MKSSLPRYWELFKFPHDSVEGEVSERDGSYAHLSPEALYTSLDDLIKIFKHPLVQGSFLDLGCGTGRGSLLYGDLFPERKAFGIEFEMARMQVGLDFQARFNIQNVTLLHADLSNCEIPVVDTYFLYFPTGPVLDRMLLDLYQRGHDFRLVAIESHGDLLPRLALENWLELTDTVELNSLRHHPCAHIYKRTGTGRDERLRPFELSFKHSYLMIYENHQQWIGESFGMEWTREDRFELKTPPRTIYWKDVQEVLTWEDIPACYHLALHCRSLGSVQIKGRHRLFEGVIRKIIIRPTFHLELSSGEKVEWEEILTIHQGRKLCYESSSD
jgi:SAM-dependent methyltransferase